MGMAKFKLSIKENFGRSLPFLAIAFYPIVWYIVVLNHSLIHYFFTYRSQIITVIAVSMILVDSLNYDI